MQMNINNYIAKIKEEDFDKLDESTEEKLELHDRQILYASDVSLRHEDIRGNIIAVLKYIMPKEYKMFSNSIEVKFENKSKEELYKYKPDLFVVCKNFKSKNETIIDVPVLIFEIVSKDDKVETILKRLTYEKFGVKEYNIIFENGDIIQYFHNGENFEPRLCHKGDMFKSNIFSDLNILVDDLIEVGYVKKLIEKQEMNTKINIAKNLLDVLDNETIALRTGLNIEEVKELRKE